MAAEVRQTGAKGTYWLTWVLWAGALAGLVYLVVLTVWLGVTGLSFPYQLDYGEGPLLHYVREWVRGQPIYKGIEGYPYITYNYAPLTVGLALIVTPLLGITYAAGRIWTLVAIAGLALILADWVRREGHLLWVEQSVGQGVAQVRWIPALAAVLVFVGSPYVYHWAPLFRVDLIGLSLTLGGLYCVWRGVSPAGPSTARGQTDGRPADRSGSVFLWLGALMFVAALYAKQSFVFAPAAALAYVFLFRDRWLALKMAAFVGLLGGGLFLLINALTQGGFWESLVVSNVNPFLWPEFRQQIQDFVVTYAVLIALAAWYVLDKYVLHRSAPLRLEASPLDLYLPLSLSSLLLAGKAGAWENYFFEALAALTLSAGLGLARLMRHRHPVARLLAPLAVLAQVALMWHTPSIASDYLRLTRESNEQMAPILKGVPDPIISEDMGLLVSNDKILDYFAFQYSQLARAGRWDQAWELGLLRERRLSLVILETGSRIDVDHYQRFTREFLSELDRNYYHSRTVGKYELYEPDPLQHERQTDFGGRLALVGWSLDAPPTIEPGSLLTLTAVWQAASALDRDYTAFAHLVDAEGRGWAGDDHPPYDGRYPTSAWGAMEMVRDNYSLQIPADAPPGLYEVRVGWYDPESGERLTVRDGDSLLVAVLPVGRGQLPPDDLVRVGADFGGIITLDGFKWMTRNGVLEVTLGWSAHSYVDTDYTVFVHLVAPGEPGRVLAQGDSIPSGGRWPTSLWMPNVPVEDKHLVQLPDDLSAGTYELLVGLYDPVTGERLILPDGGDTLPLTEVSVP